MAATLLLILNALWFGAGAWKFGLSSTTSSYGLVGHADATSRGREGVAAGFRFLGGLNLALAALSMMALIRQRDLGSDLLSIPIATAAIAHVSQFLVNLPVAIKEWRGKQGHWRVNSGIMRIIFVVDAVLAVANTVWLLANL